MNQPNVKFTDVVLYYKNLPHQNMALDWLQQNINPVTLLKFTQLWRSGPQPTQPCISPEAQTMRTSDRGIELIKEFEGCVLTAYPDPGTGGDPWTIGYGHTGSDVYEGLDITQAQAEQLLVQDLKHFEHAVIDSCTVMLTQNQFDALVSFTYNVGEGALQDSTLLAVLNEGDYEGAADQFGRWVNAGGGQLEGLVRRRAAERSLFLARA